MTALTSASKWGHSCLSIRHSNTFFLKLDGIIALLDEQQPELKVYALQQLNSLVDEFWAEISDSIAKMWVWDILYVFLVIYMTHQAVFVPLFYSEILYEDSSFSQRELAALVASKVGLRYNLENNNNTHELFTLYLLGHRFTIIWVNWTILLLLP